MVEGETEFGDDPDGLTDWTGGERDEEPFLIRESAPTVEIMSDELVRITCPRADAERDGLGLMLPIGLDEPIRFRLPLRERSDKDDERMLALPRESAEDEVADGEDERPRGTKASAGGARWPEGGDADGG